MSESPPPCFAFGSNLDETQMARRCPGASVVSEAVLRDHRLVFRGPSRNRGGGVLSVDRSEGMEVRGVLWRVTHAHVRALDAAEGAPAWYERRRVRVVNSAGVDVDAFVYCLPEHVVLMQPTAAYVDQVVAAYARWSFDAEPLRQAALRGEPSRAR